VEESVLRSPIEDGFNEEIFMGNQETLSWSRTQLVETWARTNRWAWAQLLNQEPEVIQAPEPVCGEQKSPKNFLEKCKKKKTRTKTRAWTKKRRALNLKKPGQNRAEKEN